MQILGSAKTGRKNQRKNTLSKSLKYYVQGETEDIRKKILDRNKKRGNLLTQKYPVGKNNTFFKTSLCLISQK